MLCWQLFAEPHQAANGGRGGIEYGYFVLLDNTPPPVGGGVGRYTLEQDTRRRIHERPVNAIGVTCHPAHIGGTPEHVAWLNVKYEPGGGGCSHSVAAMNMYDSLWLACAAAGVQDEEHILAVHRLARHVSIFRNICQQVVPVNVPSCLHWHVFPR